MSTEERNELNMPDDLETLPLRPCDLALHLSYMRVGSDCQRDCKQSHNRIPAYPPMRLRDSQSASLPDLLPQLPPQLRDSQSDCGTAQAPACGRTWARRWDLGDVAALALLDLGDALGLGRLRDAELGISK